MRWRDWINLTKTETKHKLKQKQNRNKPATNTATNTENKHRKQTQQTKRIRGTAVLSGALRTRAAATERTIIAA